MSYRTVSFKDRNRVTRKYFRKDFNFQPTKFLGIEDWAPPLPQVCSRLTKFVIFFKRVVILEALISTLVINAREFKINNFELSEFYNILFENSPLDVKSDQQYSMGNLFDCIRERYHV